VGVSRRKITKLRHLGRDSTPVSVELWKKGEENLLEKGEIGNGDRWVEDHSGCPGWG